LGTEQKLPSQFLRREKKDGNLTRASARKPWPQADAHDNLGVMAVNWQSRAIDLSADEAVRDDFRRRLKLYQGRQPYREEIERP
jgi:hypothetical protein